MYTERDLTYFDSFSFAFTNSLVLTLSLALTHSLALALSLALSHSIALTLSLALILSLALTLALIPQRSRERGVWGEEPFRPPQI